MRPARRRSPTWPRPTSTSPCSSTAASPTPTPTWPTAFRTVVAPVTGRRQAAAGRGRERRGWRPQRRRDRRRPGPPRRRHHAAAAAGARRASPSTTSSRSPMPEHFGLVKRTYIRARRCPARLRAAARSCASPTFTAGDAVALGWASTRPGCALVPHGIDDRRRRPPTAGRRSPCSSATACSGRPFVLYPAITYPHKNHETLRARRSPGSPPTTPTLRAGAHRRRGPVRGRSCGRPIDGLGLADRVRAHRAHPRRRPRRASTAGAAVLAFPSPLRGLRRCRCSRPWPRAARWSPPTPTALPEVVGDAGVLVDPLDARRPGPTAMRRSARPTPSARTVLVAGRRRAGPPLHAGPTPPRPWPPSTGRGPASRPRALRRSGEPRRPLPPLRARRRPHRRGHDAASPMELVARGHRLHVVTVAALVPAPRHRAGLGRPARPRTRPPSGAASPGSTRSRPTSATSRPGPWPSAASPPSPPPWAAVSTAAARRRARHVAAAHPRPGRLGRRHAPAGCPFVFNIQDVFPDVAVELGLLTRAAGSSPPPAGSSAPPTGAPTPSPCCPTTWPTTCAAKIAGPRRRAADDRKVRVIPNFVDTDAHPARPTARTPTGPSYGLTGTQGRDVRRQRRASPSRSTSCCDAARRLRRSRPDVVFVINGGGVGPARASRRAAADLPNVRFVDMQPAGAPARGAGRRRRPRRAAAGRAWPGRACRRSCTRSSPPAGRIVASVDAGTEVARTVERAGAGLAVPPDDPEAFTDGRRPAARRARRGRRPMGASGRRVRRGLGLAGRGGRRLRGRCSPSWSRGAGAAERRSPPSPAAAVAPGDPPGR